MTRLRLDVLGKPGQMVPKEGPWSTFGMINLILSFWIFLNTTILLGIGIKLISHAGISGADLVALALVNLIMFCYTVYAVTNTRRSVRDQYQIVESHRFPDVEDFLCATCCMPCTIGQMGRQSATYDEQQAACCTATGLQNETRGNQRESMSQFEMVVQG